MFILGIEDCGSYVCWWGAEFCSDNITLFASLVVNDAETIVNTSMPE